MKKYAVSSLMILLFMSAAVAAIPPSPVMMLEKVSNQLIAELKAKQLQLQEKPATVYSIVDQILLPHVDIVSMSRSALGRDAWLQANASQKKQFVKAFTDLVVRTYGGALADYNDEAIRFLPMRDRLTADTTRVQVATEIFRKEGPKIPVTYRLVYRSSGWKVYDFSVEGISMVASFRAQFADTLSKGTDINELITKIKNHNTKR